jgi:hypothetical protein
MSLKNDIAISAHWIETYGELLDELDFPDNKRNRISAAFFHLAMEHHGAIQVLVSYEPSPLYGSAAALLRPQFEAYVRGAWYHRCASEQDLENFISDNNPPNIDNLIRGLETIPSYESGGLSSVKSDSWKLMCDLTHGGVSQAASRNSPTKITGNFTDEQVQGILHRAADISLLVSIALSKLLNNDAIANQLFSTYESCFPENT